MDKDEKKKCQCGKDSCCECGCCEDCCKCDKEKKE